MDHPDRAGRGGFYSSAWLENLLGCQIVNAEKIHSGQEVKPGDGVCLHPKMPALPVAIVEPIHFTMERKMSKRPVEWGGRLRLALSPTSAFHPHRIEAKPCTVVQR